MAPRQRSNKYKHLKLPEHVEISLQKNKAGETVHYFQYRMPDGVREPIGKDREIAVAAANLLNQKFYGDDAMLQRILNSTKRKATSNNPFLPLVTAEFENEWLPQQHYSARSYRERKIKLRQYDDEWGSTAIQSIGTFELAQFLRTRTLEAQRQHGFLMRQLFSFSKGAGYYPGENPALSLLRVKAQKRKRYRHTWEGFLQVKAAADPWLARAMDAAFYSLQRRSDLVSLMIPTHIDREMRTVTVEQQKTDNYENPVVIEIAMSGELRNVVRHSFSDGIACPYLVHCRPKRAHAATRKRKPHPFAVLPDYLTRSYSNARDRSGAYDAIEDRILRPAFHDIRALGIWAYFKAGYSVEYIQALAGHADEAMTRRYEEGHEKPKPLKVEAGLKLAAVDFADIDWQTDLPAPLSNLIEEAPE